MDPVWGRVDNTRGIRKKGCRSVKPGRWERRETLGLCTFRCWFTHAWDSLHCWLEFGACAGAWVAPLALPPLLDFACLCQSLCANRSSNSVLTPCLSFCFSVFVTLSLSYHYSLDIILIIVNVFLCLLDHSSIYILTVSGFDLFLSPRSLSKFSCSCRPTSLASPGSLLKMQAPWSLPEKQLESAL